MRPVIKLKGEVLRHAACVGASRRAETLESHNGKGFDNTGKDQSVIGWNRDIMGACAERAVADWLNVEWNPPPDNSPDIDTFIQVRCTDRKDGCLIWRPKLDSPYHLFVLVIMLREQEYEIAGWLYGDVAKDKGTFGAKGKSRMKVWWVKQEDLRDPEEMYNLYHQGEFQWLANHWASILNS